MSEDQVVYGDQGISTEEYEKATYGDLTKTQSEEEDEIKCTVAQCCRIGGLPPLIPLLQYVNRLGFEMCSVKQNKEAWLR